MKALTIISVLFAMTVMVSGCVKDGVAVISTPHEASVDEVMSYADAWPLYWLWAIEDPTADQLKLKPDRSRAHYLCMDAEATTHGFTVLHKEKYVSGMAAEPRFILIAFNKNSLTMKFKKDGNIVFEDSISTNGLDDPCPFYQRTFRLANNKVNKKGDSTGDGGGGSDYDDEEEGGDDDIAPPADEEGGDDLDPLDEDGEEPPEAPADEEPPADDESEFL